MWKTKTKTRNKEKQKKEKDDMRAVRGKKRN